MKKEKTISFRVEEQEYKRLFEAAERGGVTVTKLFSDLTEPHILESYVTYRKELMEKKFNPIYITTVDGHRKETGG